MSDVRAAAPAGRATRDIALPPGAAGFHLATAVVVTAGLLLQVGLTATASGESLPVRLLRLLSSFTVQAAVLVALTSWALAARPARGISARFKVARLGALVGIGVTGVVYLVVLRPVVDLDGWWAVADTVLHYVVPLMVVVGWLVYGPRRRVDVRTVLLVQAWPVAFFGWSLVHGALTGYAPYPFVDVDARGLGAVLGNAALVLVLLLVASAAVLWLDRRLDARARARARRPRR